MSAVLIWGVGILLSLFIVFGKNHNEQDESGKLSRGFTDFAKFALVLSMYVISVQIIMAIIKIAMGFPINISKGTSIGGMIFNVLILTAEAFTLKKDKVGLIALIVLFIARTLLLVPMGTGSYTYFLGGNIVHLVRDFGLFAIAMCFKKNGVSGWKMMFLSEEKLEDVKIPETDLCETSNATLMKEGLQDVVTIDNENSITSTAEVKDATNCIIEKNTQEEESIQECSSNGDSSNACWQPEKPITKTKKNKIEEKVKKWIAYIAAFILLAFGQAVIKVLVKESHNSRKALSMHEQFDGMMYRQAKALNSRLPLRIDEYTTCTSVSYSTKNGRVLLTKYEVTDDVVSEIRKGSVMQEIKKEMMESMRVQYRNTKDAMKLMMDCNMMYKYEYYDGYGVLLNSYVLFPNEVVRY